MPVADIVDIASAAVRHLAARMIVLCNAARNIVAMHAWVAWCIASPSSVSAQRILHATP